VSVVFYEPFSQVYVGDVAHAVRIGAAVTGSAGDGDRQARPANPSPIQGRLGGRTWLPSSVGDDFAQ
jgi:hypothetical protein